jgi:hypothetical protein
MEGEGLGSRAKVNAHFVSIAQIRQRRKLAA